MARVSVVLVTWNSAYFLPSCLMGLRAQSGLDFTLQVVDNASADASMAVVREFFPEARVLRNFRNLGFCRAANQGLKLAPTEYVLLLNPDVVVHPDCLATLVAFADHHAAAASVGPKLLRREPAAAGLEPAGEGPGPPRLDGLGLGLSRGRVARNCGEGASAAVAPKRPFLVFGCSGACVLYRKAALEAVAVAGEYFDEDFFAYKEDIDLAWRLQLGGYSAWCVPTAVAAHHRRWRQPAGSWLARLVQRRAMTRELRLLSFQNHHLMLVKNEQGKNLLHDVLPILGRELLWLLAALTVEPFLWRGVPRLWRQLPAALRQRQVIQARAKVTPAQIRQWWLRGNSLPPGDPPPVGG